MKRIALIAALIGVVAYAETDTDPFQSVNDPKDFKRPAKFRQQVDLSAPLNVNFVDAGAGKFGALTVNSLSFKPTGRGTLIYDFPSIPALGAGSACQDSSAGTAAGCAFGDGVLLGIDQVIPANNNAQPPTAYVSAANAFKVRVCNDSTDGGAIDWPDASFTVTCIR